MRKHGSFGQVARDAVEGFDPFGAKDWVLDNTIGEDVDPEDLPEPDSTYVSAEAFIKGEAKAIGNVVIADAGAKGLLQYAGGARVYTSGPDKGKVELNLKIDAEAAAQLGVLTLGPEVKGKAQFIATVTLDKDHGYRPSHLRVVGTAGYNGDLGDADLMLRPTEGQLKEVQDALKAGKLESAAVGSTDGSGQQVEFRADMDLTTTQDRTDALRPVQRQRAGRRRRGQPRAADGRGRAAHAPGLRHDDLQHGGGAEGRAGRRPGRRGVAIARRSRARRLLGARARRRLDRAQLRAPALAVRPGVLVRHLPRMKALGDRRPDQAGRHHGPEGR